MSKMVVSIIVALCAFLIALCGAVCGVMVVAPPRLIVSVPHQNTSEGEKLSSLSRELSNLGPLFQVVETLVPQTTTQGEIQLAKPNALRWAIEISPPTTQATTYRVSTVSGNVALNGGVLVSIATAGGSMSVLPFERHVRRDGILPCQAWYGGISGGGLPAANITWTVIEVLLLPVD